MGAFLKSEDSQRTVYMKPPRESEDVTTELRPACELNDAPSQAYRVLGHYVQGEGLWANYSNLRVAPHDHY